MPADAEPPTIALPAIALDVRPLGERHHTGIANVTKHLAIELLGDPAVDAVFFLDRQEVPRSLVERLVRLDGGDILWWAGERAQFPQRLGSRLDQPVIGIFPTVKPARRLFPVEVQVVHDLTTLITPQFHERVANDYWQRHMLADLASSDLIVAVSESTRTDIRTYYPQVAHVPCVVATLGNTPPATGPVPGGAAEPYVLVLGTIEPRKNVDCVLDFISARPGILDQAAFVFIGRWGWGSRTRDLVEQYGLEAAVAGGKVRFTGFVSDAVRDQLVAHARCVVYPSRYEGFGLPVLEALGLGTPVVTGYGSSLPEVGGTVATYCDFTRPEAIAAALAPYLGATGDTARDGGAAARRAWAGGFRWATFYRTIKDAALAVAAERMRDAPAALG